MHQASARALHDEDEYTAPPPSRRRTVTVTGHPARREHAAPHPRQVTEIDRQRRRRRAAKQLEPRPDRVALWALFMAVLLILVTVLSSHV